MDYLASEILELIGLDLDCRSLGRWCQSASRYADAFRVELFWKAKFQRDYPTTIPSLPDRITWDQEYQRHWRAQVTFYRLFPKYANAADWVTQHHAVSWPDLLAVAHQDPILINPAIRGLHQDLATWLDFPLTRIRIPHLGATPHGESGYEITMTLQRPENYGRSTYLIFTALNQFKDRYVGAYVTSEIWAIRHDPGKDTGRISFQNILYLHVPVTATTQSNGAIIWAPMLNPNTEMD